MTVKSPILSPGEIERYKRHLVLHDVGGSGQQRLKAARVLIVGAGGLGAPVLMYLAAAGVGTLGIVDFDHVSLDNLQRQVVHATRSVGTLKVESAAETIAALNPHVIVEKLAFRLTAENAREICGRYDIVVDGSDNFATRYIVSDACYRAGRTLVFAAVGPFDGYVSTFKPHLKSVDGTPNPTYRCLFPEAPPAGTVPNCSEVGILGAVAGVVGTLAAVEVLKEIIGLDEGLVGRLMLYDARQARFSEVRYGWDADNPLSGTSAATKA